MTTSFVVLPHFGVKFNGILVGDYDLAAGFSNSAKAQAELQRCHLSVFSTNSSYFENNVRVDFQSQYEHRTVRTFQNFMKRQLFGI
jgi:hypothetical protein